VAAATITLANSLLTAVLRGGTYTTPGTVYLALYTSAPTATGAGTEVTGGSYVRLACSFSAAANGAVSNAAELDFTNMPATTVRGMALMDASSAGNMLFYGALATPKTTNAGDTFTVKLGDLSIALV
jgi:hypothetical protein